MAAHTIQSTIAAAIEKLSLPVQMNTAHFTMKDKLRNATNVAPKQ